MKNYDMCPSEAELNDYLYNKLKWNKRTELERHLSGCGACLEKLLFAYDTVSEFYKIRNVRRKKPDFRKNLWLFVAIISFALSFLMPRYFIQFLVAAVLLGGKWIFDSQNARMLITIYEAWRKGGEKEASRIVKRFDSK